MNILTTIDKYIPTNVKKSLNKQYYLNNNKEYCELASHIYNDDMHYAINNFNEFAVYYYNKKYQLEAYVKHNNNVLLYKIKQKDDYYKLSIKNKNKLSYNHIIDIDLLSQYKIFQNRGCEDFQTHFNKVNTLYSLQNTFNNYFNPDNIQDLIYLYVYLRSNCFLINYHQFDKNLKKNLVHFDDIKTKYQIGQLPEEQFLKEIYDLYNKLYSYFDTTF